MRRLIEALQPLFEGSVAYRGHGFQIIENPGRAQLNNMLANAKQPNEGLRAILSGGVLFVWDGYFMNHDEASEVLGCDDGPQVPQLHLRLNHVELDIASIGLWDEEEDGFLLRTVTELIEVVRSNRILNSFYGSPVRVSIDDGSKDEWAEAYLERLRHP